MSGFEQTTDFGASFLNETFAIGVKLHGGFFQFAGPTAMWRVMRCAQ